MQVIAVRHHPVSFAEVRPLAGGQRFSLPLRLVEQATASMPPAPLATNS